MRHTGAIALILSAALIEGAMKAHETTFRVDDHLNRLLDGGPARPVRRGRVRCESAQDRDDFRRSVK